MTWVNAAPVSVLGDSRCMLALIGSAYAAALGSVLRRLGGCGLWSNAVLSAGGRSSLTPFFSVQRLHGFRQVVQHVQLHVAN